MVASEASGDLRPKSPGHDRGRRDRRALAWAAVLAPCVGGRAAGHTGRGGLALGRTDGGVSVPQGDEQHLPGLSLPRHVIQGTPLRFPGRAEGVVVTQICPSWPEGPFLTWAPGHHSHDRAVGHQAASLAWGLCER